MSPEEAGFSGGYNQEPKDEEEENRHQYENAKGHSNHSQ